MRLCTSSISTTLAPVALTAKDYVLVLDQLAALGVAGGQVYDALILRCAAKAKATAIYTWNIKHFRALATPELFPLIREPGSQ